MSAKTEVVSDVSAVSVSLPLFCLEAPALWFAQAEAQFHLRHITSRLTKFYHTIASLLAAIATRMDDLVTPRTEDPYAHLKTQLLARFGRSKEDCFRMLMQPASSELLRPTEILRGMRRAGETAGESLDPNGPLMERLFLERLPNSIRLLLKAGMHESLDALAARADELAEIDETNSVNTLSRRQDSERRQSKPNREPCHQGDPVARHRWRSRGWHRRSQSLNEDARYFPLRTTSMSHLIRKWTSFAELSILGAM
uniref:Retrotransposon gag domain-containing protein n=1 Tax=Trichuris muris TaxID=70415 RepID=A0A5S6Q170_TRIMR